MDNAQTVVAFFEQAFNGNEPELAVSNYLGQHYIQHNPQAGDGPEPFIGYVHWVRGQHPNLQL